MEGHCKIQITTQRGPIECSVSGQGPVVLLLHGAMGGHDQAMLLGRAAVGSSGFQLIAPSRPGYLDTPLAFGRTPEDQADLCADLLDSLKIRDTALIAISGGGLCALQFALRHPQRCRGLVMISACSAPRRVRLPLKFHLMKLAARFPALIAAMRRKAMRDPDRAAQRSIPDAELRVRTLADPEAGPMLRELQWSTLDRMDQRLPGTENDIRQSRLPFSYPLERISAPVLAVHGTADQTVPFEQARLLASRVRNGELLAIDGGGHVSIFTHHREIRARVLPFLAHLA